VGILGLILLSWCKMAFFFQREGMLISACWGSDHDGRVTTCRAQLSLQKDFLQTQKPNWVAWQEFESRDWSSKKVQTELLFPHHLKKARACQWWNPELLNNLSLWKMSLTMAGELD